MSWRAQGDDFRTFLGDFVAALHQIEFSSGTDPLALGIDEEGHLPGHSPDAHRRDSRPTLTVKLGFDERLYAYRSTHFKIRVNE